MENNNNNEKQFPPSVLEWCDRNWLFPGRGKVFYHVSKLKPLERSELNETLNKGNSIGVYTKFSDIICIDIDNVPVAEAFLELLKESQTLLIRTPRGGIHIYFQKPDDFNQYNFGNTYRITQLGVVVEFKSDTMVVLLGQGYSILHFPLSGTLDKLPKILYPFPWIISHSKYKSVVLIKEDLIKEGDRNNRLFSWANFLLRNKKEVLISLEEVIPLLANFFCDPPLSEENEINNIINVKNRIQESPFESDELARKPSVWVDYLKEKWGPFRYRFHDTEQSWYRYNEQKFCWVPISLATFQRDICYEFENSSSSDDLRNMTFINNCSKLFEIYFKIDEEEVSSVVGIGFLNGFLDLNKLCLEPHSPERFTTSTLPVDYNPSEKIETTLKELLSIYCKKNLKPYLNHLRGFVKRAIKLEISCQTILLLSGPPGTGKSTLISFLSAVFGRMLFVFDVRGKNQFDRFAWVGKRILVLNDVTRIDPPLVEILRQLSGRDRIKYDIKNKQINRDFVYEGIIIMVSNHSADVLLTPLLDLALFDRVIEINLQCIPKKKIRSLTDYMIKGASGFISWAMHCPDIVLQSQIRSYGSSVTSDNPIIWFIGTKLFWGEKEIVGFSTLKNEFELFMEDISVRLNTISQRTPNFFTILENFCLTFFNVGIVKFRASSGIFVRGIRLVKSTEKSNMIFTKTDDPLEKINPWSYNEEKVFFDFKEVVPELINDLYLETFPSQTPHTDSLEFLKEEENYFDKPSKETTQTNIHLFQVVFKVSNDSENTPTV